MLAFEHGLLGCILFRFFDSVSERCEKSLSISTAVGHISNRLSANCLILSVDS